MPCPSRVAWILLPWVLAGGCGPDLAKLETEQQSLEQEVSVLHRKVEDMRTQVKAMGLEPNGPAVDAAAAVGTNDLAGKVQFTAERAGAAPTFPPLTKPEHRRENTDCGYRFSVPWLESISDQVLEQSGSGRSSPVVLQQDGKALEPHSGPVNYEKTCKFAFRHQPKYLFFSPADAVENVGGTWSMALSPELPLPRSDDRPMYWVYPGTTLTFTFRSGWDESWGTMTVKLDARVLHVGTPDAPAPRKDVAATASVLGFEQSSADPRLGFENTPDPPDGPWTLEITSPSNGPYVLVETLVVGNNDHSLIVTAEGKP